MHSNTVNTAKGQKGQKKQKYVKECKQPTELLSPDSLPNFGHKQLSGAIVNIETK